MRYLHIDFDRSLSLREAPAPRITDPDDVLIRTSYASICNYDLMILRGDAAVSSDNTIGHEASGIVVDTGSNVSSPALRPGSPVTMEVYNHCMLCDECRRGNPEYCTNPAQMNSFFMSEYIKMPQQYVYRLPDKDYLKSGCLTEPLMMAMYAVKKARLRYGSTVLLLGAGAMGQIILQTLLLHPISMAVVADPSAKMRSLALQSGATHVLPTENLFVSAMELTDNRGFDAVIEASGSRTGAESAFPLVARGGSVVYFSLYGMDYDLSINAYQLYWKDATIQCVCVPSNSFLQAIQLLPRLHLEDAITGLYPFDQAVEAFHAKAAGGHAKVMIEF